MTARVSPVVPGVTIHFDIVSDVPGDSLDSSTALTDGDGKASVTYTAGISNTVVRIDATVDSTALSDPAYVYVSSSTAAVQQRLAVTGVDGMPDLAPSISITKTGAGTPWMGVARFVGNPCLQSVQTVSPMGYFVDVLLEDPTDVDSLTLSVGYTATVGTPALFWCGTNGQWQSASASTVDAGNKTVTLPVTDITTPNLDDLEGTPLVVGNTTPLAMTLGWFLAERDADAVDFHWQTVTETGTAGFNVFATVDGDKLRLNNELIPSPAIGAVTPTDYAFSAFTDATRFYLHEVGINGGVNEYGPFEQDVESGTRVRQGGDEMAPVLWLPLVQR